MLRTNRLSSKRGVILDGNALLLRITGLIALLNVPFKHLPSRVNEFVEFNLATTSRYTSLVLGIMLLYLAAQIVRKKHSAFWLAVAVTGLLILVELVHFRNPLRIGLYVATLLSLIKDRRDYVVRSDFISVKRAGTTAFGILLALLLFVGVTIQVINRRNFGHELSPGEVIDILLRALAGLPQPDYAHVSHFGNHIVRLLHLAAISSVIFIGLSLFQPLRLRRPASHSQRRLAERLTVAYSRSSEDYLKLWPRDKHYFFYKQSFVAYGVRGGVAVIIDGPTGNPADCVAIRRAFLDEARINGWTIAVVHADAHEAAAWQELGLQSLFIGSEAVVDVPEYVSKTSANKHFRYVRNKAAKEGLQFAYWSAPLSEQQVRQLQLISDAWLAGSNRREYRFIMGYFSASYLQRCDMGVVMRDGVAVAYVNMLPIYSTTLASIDHMRAMPGIPAVSMHFLLMELIKYVVHQGVTSFNLGLAPLSQLEEQPNSGLTKRILNTIKTVSGRYYSTGGLEQFKGKFQPNWQARYLVYEGAPPRLAAIAAALNLLTTYRPKSWTKLGTWLVAGAGIAAAGYCAFPLAYIVNRDYFWQGLVSGLAEPGQPYNWLFNGLDSLSAVVGTVVFGYLYWRQRRGSKAFKFSLALVILASASDLITVLVPLPYRFDTTAVPTAQLLTQPAVLIHGAASFINSAAFVVSLGLWAYTDRHRNKGNVYRMGLFVAVVFIGIAGSYIGHVYPASAASLQRVFILAYGLWLVSLAVAAVKRLTRTVS